MCHALEDILQMLEAIAQVSSLTGGRFQVDRDRQAFSAGVNLIESPSDSLQTGFLPLAHV